MYKIFKEALNAEYDVDIFFSKKISQVSIICFRALAIKKIIDRFFSTKNSFTILFLNVFICTTYILWILLFPLCFFSQFIFYFINFKPSFTNSFPKNNKILMGTIYHSIRMLPKVDKLLYKDCTFIKTPCPWYQIKPNLDAAYGLPVFDISNALTVLDHIKCLILSVIFSYKYIFTSTFSKSMQTFVTYEFLLVFLFLQRIITDNTVLIFMNYCDRWQILFDRFPSNCYRILVQHGVLFLNVEIFKNLKCYNLNEVYYFDEKSKDVMVKYISNSSRIIFKPINNRINLTKFEKINNNKTILLIPATYDNFEEQTLLIRGLLAENYNIMIKPHPILGTNCPKDLYDKIFLIKDRNFFPIVDMVVAIDDSTLGVEYEYMGIPVIWLRDFNEIGEVISKIKLLLAKKTDMDPLTRTEKKDKV